MRPERDDRHKRGGRHSKDSKAARSIDRQPEEARRLAEEFRDKYLRAQAELENSRKRQAREKAEYIKFANETLLSEILYVADNFDRALGHLNGAQNVASILEGIKMIQKQFHLLLEKEGVKKIESIGKKFDPALHEAIEDVDTDEDKKGIIIEEVQAGYTLNERLLRPAAVKVGKGRRAPEGSRTDKQREKDK